MAYNNEIMRQLTACAAACERCVDACLDEDDIHMMVPCIRLARDCAKICFMTASFIASNSAHAKHLAKECEEICRACADECSKHKHEHCKECAEACHLCAEACKSFLAA